jgi:hypothetical protein
MGTDSARPSDSSTTRASAVTMTPFASGVLTSVGEEVIPFLPKQRCTRHHESFYPLELKTPEPDTLVEAHRVEPELRSARVALHVHMGRLVPVVRVEEHPVRTFPEDSRQ